MGDPSRYPDIRMARFMYAMHWLPPDLRAHYHASATMDRQQHDLMTYLDARALAVLQDGDHSFRRDTWPEYHNLHMCRLGVAVVFGDDLEGDV
eukprot:scaffold3551_cov118-Isochrysis_galbana.AAC.6